MNRNNLNFEQKYEYERKGHEKIIKKIRKCILTKKGKNVPQHLQIRLGGPGQITRRRTRQEAFYGTA